MKYYTLDLPELFFQVGGIIRGVESGAIGVMYAYFVDLGVVILVPHDSFLGVVLRIYRLSIDSLRRFKWWLIDKAAGEDA